MAIGLMRDTITIKSKTITKDSQGFQTETLTTIVSCRAYREGRHGSAAWRNRAAYTDATESFTIRNPATNIDTSMIIENRGKTFEIVSIENVKGRGMYLEILAKAVEPNGSINY